MHRSVAYPLSLWYSKGEKNPLRGYLGEPPEIPNGRAGGNENAHHRKLLRGSPTTSEPSVYLKNVVNAHTQSGTALDASLGASAKSGITSDRNRPREFDASSWVRLPHWNEHTI